MVNRPRQRDGIGRRIATAIPATGAGSIPCRWQYSSLAKVYGAMQLRPVQAMLERDDAEHPVPAEWHPIFCQIADAFAAGDFQLRDHPVDRVSMIAPATASSIAASVSAYGDRLAPLHPSTWSRSVYRWMEGYWQLLVDLTTESEEVSDLTLHAKIHDADPPTLEIESVHVA